MGGGGSKSTSTSGPVLLPEQKKIWDWTTANQIPLAEGKETYLSQLMAQRARDEAAALQGQQTQQIQQVGGTTGMSAGQIGQLMGNQQQQYIQATLANILAQRQAQQGAALQMIQGLPISPGQMSKSTQKGEDPFKASFGRAVGTGLGNIAVTGVGAGMGGMGVPGMGAMSGLPGAGGA